MALTAEDARSKGAAGDAQVMGIFLCVELFHVQVPQTQVSVGGAGHKHLTARAEGAGYHRRVAYPSGPSQRQPTEAASTVRLHMGLDAVKGISGVKYSAVFVLK